jgi:aspartate aminotransferase
VPLSANFLSSEDILIDSKGGRPMHRASRAVREILLSSERQVLQATPEVISLATGDPDFPTPEHITQALAEAVRSGATHYAQQHGDPELQAVLAEQLGMTAGRSFAPRQVLITHGASGAIAAAVLSTVEAGERVIIPDPTYSLFADMVHIAGGVVVFVRHDEDFHLDLKRIETEAAIGARLIIICNPCNPTGAVYSKAELEELGRIATRYGQLVLVDEAYDHIVFDNMAFVSALEIESLAENLIYVQSFSKTYAMCGWRIGYLAGEQRLVQSASCIHRTLNGPVNSAVQRAAIAATLVRSDLQSRMRQEFQERRDAVVRMVADTSEVRLIVPQGAIYAFLGYSATNSALQVVRKALADGVAVRPGTEFGPDGEGFVRVALAADRDVLAEGMARLVRSLSEMK